MGSSRRGSEDGEARGEDMGRVQRSLHAPLYPGPRATHAMSAHFERHRQAWTAKEVQQLRLLVSKGASLKSIAKSLTRSEESVKSQAKIEKLKISKMR